MNTTKLNSSRNSTIMNYFRNKVIYLFIWRRIKIEKANSKEAVNK